ncbi:hypothetical protein ACWDU8_29065 [Streptomyces sp. NPDC003388]
MLIRTALLGSTRTGEHGRSFTAFDALGRLTPRSVTGVGDRTVQHRAYSYRADGNQIGRFMSTRTVDAMKALSRFGELAWFKLPTEYNDEYGYHQVAYMGWRYKAPREGVVHSVNTRDQEFCIASISDLALIVQHLQRVPVP